MEGVFYILGPEIFNPPPPALSDGGPFLYNAGAEGIER